MKEPSHSGEFRVRLNVQRHERVHKVFIIHASAEQMALLGGSDFRILTKERADGMIELIAYQYWFDGVDDHQGNVLRAPAVPPERLIDLVRRVVEGTGTDIRQMEVLDLTTERSQMDQADRLAQHDLLDAFDFQEGVR